MPDSPVTFSVIVPTFNRLHLLKKTLESLFRQDFTDFEVIVVNDGGTDGTTEYLKELEAQANITGITQPNAGLAATRRRGLQAAQGSFIAFTDDDCVVPVDWLSRIHRAFQSSGAAGIGGATETGNPGNPYALVNDIMHNYFKRHHASRPGSAPFLTGNNVAYRRDALERAGGPDPRFRMGAEDRDLAWRVSASGGTIVYDPSIVVRHFNDSDFPRYLRQQYRYGVGSALYYAESGRGGASRPAPASIGAYLGLLVEPFRHAGMFRAFFHSFLIVAGQVAVIAGFLSRKIRGRSTQG